MLDALLEAPIDSRRALAGNIILGGGLSRLPGLPRRLLQEIDIRIKEEKYQKLKNLDVSVYFFILSNQDGKGQKENFHNFD